MQPETRNLIGKTAAALWLAAVAVLSGLPF